jgi:hypothetical protein
VSGEVHERGDLAFDVRPIVCLAGFIQHDGEHHGDAFVLSGQALKAGTDVDILAKGQL